MGSKPAVLQCSKCGKGAPPPLPAKPGTPAPDVSKCPSCGGRVVRICGSCGFRNSAAKNYCDICGDMLMLADPKSAPPKPGAQPPASKPGPAEPQRFIVVKPPSQPPPRAQPPKAPEPGPFAPKPAEPGPFAPKAPPPQPAPEGPGPFSPKRYETPKSDEPGPFAPKTPPAEPPPPDEPGPFSPLRWQKPKIDTGAGPASPAAPAAGDAAGTARKENDPRAVKTPAEEPGPFSPQRWRKPGLEKGVEPAAPPPPPNPPVPRGEPQHRPESSRAPTPSGSGTPSQEGSVALPAGPSPLSLVPPPNNEPEPAKEVAESAQEPYPEFRAPARSSFLEVPKTGIIRIADQTPKEAPEEPVPGQASKEDKAKFKLRAENTGVLRDKMAKRHIELRHSPGEGAKAPKPGKPAGTRVRALASTSIGILLLLAGLLLYGFYYWNFRRNPRVRVMRSAAKYLTSLQTGDIDTAYGMLSPISRSNCPRDDFRRLQSSGWSFGSITLESLDKDWATVRYVSRSPKGEETAEFGDFVLEDGRWMRAFNANQLEAAETAIVSMDFELADQFARGALAVNPRDALARSYQCEAAYYQNRIQDALGECSAAIDLAKKVPSEMDEHRLFYLHGIISDLYKNRLDRPGDAVREYNILLALPGQSPAQRCDILLARADARAMLNTPQDALKDYQEASGVCNAGEDLDYAQRSVRVFSGQAGEEAVAAVQHHRTADDESTLLEWREKARKELSAKLKAQGSKLRPGSETWTPEQIGGPNYRVSLRSADVEILSGKVDLWSGKVKVDVYVQ